MSEFLAMVLGYPTLVYSVALAFCAIYWALAATGLADLDWLDFADTGETEGLAGIFARLGLDRVPVMVVLTLLAFFGWFVTYFVHLFLLAPLWGWLRWVLGTVVALLALAPAVVATTLVLKPLRRWLAKLQPPAEASLLGRMAVVRSPTVSSVSGTADLDDGGAGLVLQVRAQDDAVLRRGDRVVLVEFDAAGNSYRVVAEDRYRHI